ncbi:MAG: hypothetical protein SVE93_03000 [Candidatus Thermoplasmatota archaeon]|nr:hypothetical protein [Candidatus Thermoplasmatota archaeon]
MWTKILSEKLLRYIAGIKEKDNAIWYHRGICPGCGLTDGEKEGIERILKKGYM